MTQKLYASRLGETARRSPIGAPNPSTSAVRTNQWESNACFDCEGIGR
jgi:hypothetical protein